MSLESENGVEKKLEKTLEKQNLLEKETKSESDDINFKSEFKEGSYEFSSSEKRWQHLSHQNLKVKLDLI